MNAISAWYHGEISDEQLDQFISEGYVLEQDIDAFNTLIAKYGNDASKSVVFESFTDFLNENTTGQYSDLAQYAICECIVRGYLPESHGVNLQNNGLLSTNNYQFIQENSVFFSETEMLKLEGIYYGLGLTESQIMQMPLFKEYYGASSLSESSETPISELLKQVKQ